MSGDGSAGADGMPGADALAIAGLVPWSSVDWPDRMVATVFCQGCPWQCAYCHNQAILDPRAPGTVPWSRVRSLLDRRRGLLDGVVFSGGEATRQLALVEAARQVRERGFAVGLHTGGAYPQRLQALVAEGLIDWVGFDLKAPAERYGEIVGRAGAYERMSASLEMLMDAGIALEVRMTVTPALADAVDEVVADACARGVRCFALQQAREEGTSPDFRAEGRASGPEWDAEFARIAAGLRAAGVFETCTIRPA